LNAANDGLDSYTDFSPRYQSRFHRKTRTDPHGIQIFTQFVDGNYFAEYTFK